MLEVIFLFALGLIWIIFATVQDIRTKEISNWLNFSLIIFALGFRFFYSLFAAGNFSFFYQGLIGFVIFLILGNLLYYGRMFAGGDAKLFISLGPIIPLSGTFSANLGSFMLFFLVFLLAGAAYSILISTSLAIRHSKKFGREFRKQFNKNKSRLNLLMLLAILALVLGIIVNYLLVFLGVIIFVLPYLYLFAKSVDETAMVKNAPVYSLSEGDWLYHDVHIGKKVIKATWDGLSRQDINLLRKRGKNFRVKIREGVFFSPVFLIGYIVFFYLWSRGLGNSFW